MNLNKNDQTSEVKNLQTQLEQAESRSFELQNRINELESEISRKVV